MSVVALDVEQSQCSTKGRRPIFSRDYYHARTRKLYGIRYVRSSAAPASFQVLILEVTGARQFITGGDHPLYGKHPDASLPVKRTYLCPTTQAEAAAAVRGKVEMLEHKRFSETERSLSRRSFELRGGRSQKFWVIELEGSELLLFFGRIPQDVYHGYSGGRFQLKTFPSPEDARSAYDKMIREKLAAGYRECHARRTADLKPTTATGKKKKKN